MFENADIICKYVFIIINNIIMLRLDSNLKNRKYLFENLNKGIFSFHGFQLIIKVKQINFKYLFYFIFNIY